MSSKLITITLSEYDHLLEIAEKGEEKHRMEMDVLKKQYDAEKAEKDRMLKMAVDDMKVCGLAELCEVCACETGNCEEAYYVCKQCKEDGCKCRDCRSGSHFKWRGMKGGQTKNGRRSGENAK